MSDPTISSEQLQAAVFSARFAALARADVDLATWKTWDHTLPRNKRILVPIDVQALVVPSQGGEPTVPVGALMDDPLPFDPGEVPAPGVHLHWALPDALLRGQHDEANKSLRMDPLPDRWVVVRTLLPEGARTAYASGWVIDAVHGVVVPLATFSGSIDQALIDASEAPVLSPLDGSSRGTLLWTATYQGAVNRFALHDPLTDLDSLKPLAPHGFHRGRAVYTVAGWWTDASQDPLSGTAGTTGLDRRLAALGWYVTGDGGDDLDEGADPKLSQLATYAGLTSPPSTAPVTTVTEYSQSTVQYSGIEPKTKIAVDEVSEVVIGLALPRYYSMLHGSVLGVPIDGSSAGADDRPAGSAVAATIGLDLDDIAAAFAAPGFGLDPAHRQTAEQLMAAFTGGLLSRIGTSDGLDDLQEREHSDGFWAMPGPPIPGAKPDRLRTEDTTARGPLQVGRKGRAALADSGARFPQVKAQWKTGVIGMTSIDDESAQQQKKQMRQEQDAQDLPVKPAGSDAPVSRDVVRAAPRMFRPTAVMVGLRGVKPSLRHHGDGLFDSQGLRCRYPNEVTTTIEGVVDGAAILATLGSGAIPPEVTRVVREAVVLDGYSWSWLAAAGTSAGVNQEAAVTRVVAEMTRLYGTQSRYDGTGAAFVAEVAGARARRAAAKDGGWEQYHSDTLIVQGQVASEFARFSLAAGTPPSPVALTTWRQPWVPLFVEWQVRLVGSALLDGWSLTDGDLEPGTVGSDVDTTLTGRSPVTTGIAKTLTAAIDQWLVEENQRDTTDPSSSQLDEPDEAALDRLADLLRPLDLVSTSLDGLREQLLGIAYNGLVVRTKAADGTAKPPAVDLPTPLFGGTLTVEKLRAVDAFGRVLDLPTGAIGTTTTLEVAGQPSTVLLRPRIQNQARWLLRMVDPGYALSDDPGLAPEAYVDQLRAALAVTPVSGFLLPDHIDEALEVFDRDGNPLGQVMHDSVTDAVTWEVAPARPLPPDAGPLADIAPHAQHAALVAVGLIQADVNSRHGDQPPTSSSLSALLRAIDSTLWTVDTFTAIGSPTIAGLVGRPVAVVRLTVRLDAPDDVDEVDLAAAPGGAQARREAFGALADQLFPFRLGELGRSDDSVLGFFVDDDYLRFHVVDQVVASAALESGRQSGHLGLLGTTPTTDPIDHPYLDLEDTLLIRPGQTVRLTVLMLPAGKLHLTSGVLPRKVMELADEWVTPGLTKLVPSMRVGPVLVDPAEIRLPNVSSLGANQQFTRRTGPLTWKDDPILASTTNAYLPKAAHEAQEGWIRVAPAPPDPDAPSQPAGGEGSQP
ncbi:hypothetical protein ACPPVT_12555 [Angustibacter sp. McL0619]|uniref:hypothetical protein n=1 Tax=Angustibacter sp. McL0619 TaxID=3415676 RepID=UPI003CF30552